MTIEALVREISQQIPPESWISYLPPSTPSSEPEFYCHCDYSSSSDCDCLERHNQAVAGLKRDLKLAAKAGQTLLTQVHKMETQLVDQEAEFKARQQELVAQNNELLRKNADLLESTRDSAHSLAESEARIAQLTAQLAEANARSLRLNSYMSLAQSLEHQVGMLESVQDALQGELSAAKQNRSLAESRWRAAEHLVVQVSKQYKQLSLDVNTQSRQPQFLSTESTPSLDDEPANWRANRTLEVPSLDDIDDTIDSSFDIDTDYCNQRLSTPLRQQKSVPATLSATPRPPYHIPSFKSLDELKAAAAAAAAAESAQRYRPIQPQRSMQHLEPVPARVSTAMSKETLHGLRPTMRRNMSHESVLSMVVEPMPIEVPEISLPGPARATLTDSTVHATKSTVKADAREQLRGLQGLRQQPEPRRETTRWMFVPFRR